MTNIEKVKRILDAGHYAKVTYNDGGYIQTVTSYHNNEFSYTDKNPTNIYTVRNPSFKDCTIEVIQRIPTAYKAGEKVLVLSHPELDVREIQSMVGTICTIKSVNIAYYGLWNENKDNYFYFPYYCLSPVFEEDSLSGKEAKIVIDGKEYSVTLKLI